MKGIWCETQFSMWKKMFCAWEKQITSWKAIGAHLTLWTFHEQTFVTITLLQAVAEFFSALMGMQAWSPVLVCVYDEGWRSGGDFHAFYVLQHRVGAAESFASSALLMRCVKFSWKHLGCLVDVQPWFGKFFIVRTRAAGCHRWKQTLSAGWRSVSSWGTSLHRNPENITRTDIFLNEPKIFMYKFTLRNVFYTSVSGQ